MLRIDVMVMKALFKGPIPPCWTAAVPELYDLNTSNSRVVHLIAFIMADYRPLIPGLNAPLDHAPQREIEENEDGSIDYAQRGLFPTSLNLRNIEDGLTAWVRLPIRLAVTC